MSKGTLQNRGNGQFLLHFNRKTKMRNRSHLSADEITVNLGVTNLLQPSSSSTNYTVEEIINHEEYSTRTKQNDVALLKLQEAVVVSKEVHPICLPPPVLTVDSTLAYVAGKKILVINSLGIT